MALEWLDIKANPVKYNRIRKLPPEVKMLWCRALRSGRYKQNFSLELRTSITKYSPMGVLVQLYRKTHPNDYLKWIRQGSGDNAYWAVHYGMRQSTAFTLPPQVMRWVGVDTPTVYVQAVIDSVCLDYPIIEYALENVQENGLLYVPVNTLHDCGMPFYSIAKLIEDTA